jgi:hypothetical protein
MTRFWRRERRHDVEHALRASRPEPRSEFVETLTERLESAEPRRLRRPTASMRLVFAVVLGAAIAASAGTVGGLAAGGGNGGGGDRGGRHFNIPPAVAAALGEGVDPFSDQYQGRIPVCHRGRTLFLPPRAALAHLLHGDALGPCDDPITIQLCHRGHTIEVPIGREVLRHLRHGDRLGPCQDE